MLERVDVLGRDDYDVARCGNTDERQVDGLGQSTTAGDAALDDEKVQVALWATMRSSAGRALDLVPFDAFLFHSRGMALHRLGRSADALKDLDRALLVRPTIATTNTG